MITFLDPKKSRVATLETNGAAQNLNALLATSYNFILLSTDETTGFDIHIRMDGNDAEDPDSLPATPTPGMVLFLVAGSPQPLAFDANKAVEISVFAATGKTIKVSSAAIRTDSRGAV